MCSWYINVELLVAYRTFSIIFFFFQEGHTFLMVASKNGELNIVRELLEAGVDPNAVDNVSCSRFFKKEKSTFKMGIFCQKCSTNSISFSRMY